MGGRSWGFGGFVVRFVFGGRALEMSKREVSDLWCDLGVERVWRWFWHFWEENVGNCSQYSVMK